MVKNKLMLTAFVLTFTLIIQLNICTTNEIRAEQKINIYNQESVSTSESYDKQANNSLESNSTRNWRFIRKIQNVQPFTGIVFWKDSKHNATDAISMEFAYVGYNQIVNDAGEYDWSYLEEILNDVKSRKHQMIIRFYDTYPGKPTTVPDFIRDDPKYYEIIGKTKGLKTSFPDWSNEKYQGFVLEFMEKFALRYDHDPRIAFIQVGFGLWSEYHIYDGPMVFGQTFPSKAYQKQFFESMNSFFNELKWSVSIDSGNAKYGPFQDYTELLEIPFGVFDDSFLSKTHDLWNANNFKALDLNRFIKAPVGGELNYYSKKDQKEALSKSGPHGTPFYKIAKRYNLSYILGNDQPKYQPMSVIKRNSTELGYKFKVLSIKVDNGRTIILVSNIGIAPIYYDAYFKIDGIRSEQSLKGLLPNEQSLIVIEASFNPNSELKIACDHLIEGQNIEFDADVSIIFK